jgi:hypothetical protein
VGEQAGRAAGLALVLVLSLLTTVWGAFLVPLRPFGVALPLAVPLALVANLVLGLVGGRLYGRLGAALPALLWFGAVGVLVSLRPGGDVVVTGSLTGLSFLLLGTIAAAVPIGATSPRRRAGAGERRS